MNKEEKLLQKIGIKNFEELLPPIPKELLFPQINIPEGKTELELTEYVESLAAKNPPVTSFLGAGAYDHFVPQTVWELAKRGEFLTAYTPYQAEASQGTLLALFEFQTMMTELFAMEATNASLYEGATALAEAVIMSRRWHQEELGLAAKKLLIPRALHPHYKSTLATYTVNLGVHITEVPYDRKTGKLDLAFLENALNDPEAFGFVAGQPNFFGVLEDVDALAEIRQKTKALFIALVNNPITLGILRPPGEYNADIAVAEGQPLGLAVNYGGPNLGLMAAKNLYMRKMPGRICGKTVDAEGKTSYTLTLQTREQHIRREKATSNICTNQSLCALAATIYLSLLGPKGLKEAAELTFSRAHELLDRLVALKGKAGRPLFEHGEFFQEFPFETQITAERLEVAEAAAGIIPGYPLSRDFSELPNTILIATTEKTTPAMMDQLTDFLQGNVIASEAKQSHKRGPF
ncbi:MAG: aminomethyl-transferring glycine dehydrogenase subunit GcvPA [Elusimicrobia bacterium]|nr:aminomethyl-transferring glycine dehydrogenase subunit GcvPA [Elusimicrobiota bacterium]